MRGLLFDLETNWIEPKGAGAAGVSVVHCGATIEFEIEAGEVRSGEAREYGPGARSICALCAALETVDVIAGHNVARFDVPVLERLHHLELRPVLLLDTLSMSRMAFASNHERRGWAFRNAAGRSERAREARLPQKLVRSHSLEAWGYKLGARKHVEGFDSPEAFARYTPELAARCMADAMLNLRLLCYLVGRGAERGWPACSLESFLTESEYAYVMGKQVANGVGYDDEAGRALAARWTRRQEELSSALRSIFGPWWAPAAEPKTTKRGATYRKDRAFPEERVEGAEHQAVKLLEFNPGSRAHVADRFRKVYGWEPSVFTPTGDPEVSEGVLDGLDYPAAPLVREYLTLEKRLGMLSEGKQSWYKACRDGVIRSEVAESGARTTRVTHRNGLAQVPKIRKNPETKQPLLEEAGAWGWECRSLFRPTRWRDGWVMVGADASGIQLRMLAHYMARWDGGAFARTMLESDPHADWMRHTGILIRDDQKEFNFSLLFGAGEEKLGSVFIESWRRAHKAGLTTERPPPMSQAADYGRARKGRLLHGLPALDRLIEQTKAAHRRGWIRLIDGAVVGTDSEHGALNDLLQGGEARVMKRAKVLFDRGVRDHGTLGYMLDVHDEWQIESDPALAERHGVDMVAAIRRSGEELCLRILLDGQFRIGNNWAETH